MSREIPHLLGGKLTPGTSGRFGDVYDPSTGVTQARVPLASADEVREAISLAAAAQPEWAAQNPMRILVERDASCRLCVRCTPAMEDA